MAARSLAEIGSRQNSIVSGASLRNMIFTYVAAGDHAQALAWVKRIDRSVIRGQFGYEFRDLLSAQVHEAAGDSERARQAYLAALPLAERIRDQRPESIYIYPALAQIYAGLGQKEAALAAARKGVALVPVTKFPRFASTRPLTALATVFARFGQMDEALVIVRDQIDKGFWKRNELLLHPDFIHLQPDPRFRALAEKAPL